MILYVEKTIDYDTIQNSMNLNKLLASTIFFCKFKNIFTNLKNDHVFETCSQTRKLFKNLNNFHELKKVWEMKKNRIKKCS